MKPDFLAQVHDAMNTVASAGIPYAYREKSPVNGDEKSSAAGILFITPQQTGLFLKRGGPGCGNNVGQWDLPGGHLDKGERPEDAARREAMEEIGHLPGWQIAPMDRTTSDEGVDYTTFVQLVAAEFEPHLNTNEHTDWIWAPLSVPPYPLHKELRRLLGLNKEGEPKVTEDEALAFDKGSVRISDVDGRMHVAASNISKANVCPYKGKEIPGYDELGLEPNKVYMLLRHPDELAKAAPTFNNIQVLRRHVPVSADDHRPYDVVGTTGSDAEFVFPYLRNSLSIWEKSAIDSVENEEKRELSCGYHYIADMTPGEYEGEAYDGVMRNIVGNHVALVKEGRAGPDVVVGDEALSEDELLCESSGGLNMHIAESLSGEEKMATEALPTKFAALALQLTRYALAPVLAKDAKVDLLPLFKDLTAKNFAERKKDLVKSIEKAVKGKLAQDATLSHVTDLLDHLEHPSSDESVSGPQHRAMAAAAEGHSDLGIPKGVGEEFKEADKGKHFGDMKAARDALSEFLRNAGHDEEMIGKACDMMYPAADAYVEGKGGNEEEHHKLEEKGVEEEDKLEREAGETKGKDNMPAHEKTVSLSAMDSAIKAAVSSTTKKVAEDVRKAERERHMALDEVSGYVGKLSPDVVLGLDSADDVYRHALVMLGVDEAKNIHPSALRTILKLQKKAGAREKEQRIAQDEAGRTSEPKAGFYERFPGAERLRA